MSSTGLWDAWERTVGKASGALAIVDSQSGSSLSRRELSRAAEELAARLPDLSERVVAFAEPNGADWFRAFLAVQKLGAIALPLDAGLPAARHGEVAAELGAAMLLPNGELIPSSTPSTRTSGRGSDVCLLKLTSGTTDAPRGLPFTSAQMLADGRQVCAGMGIGPDDVNFGAIPFGHSYGLGNLVLPLLAQGTVVACSSESLPAGLAAGIARTGATVFPTVPALLRGLAESTSVAKGSLASLRRVISAGAFLRPEVATDFYAKFGRVPHNFYGSSETGGICFDGEGSATLSGRSVGRPLPGVSVELDATAGDRVRVRSPAVTAPGTHLLADRGEWTPEGELRLLGRTGSVANVGGRKVDPAEVEQILRGFPEVTDAWVGVRTRPNGEDFLIAAVETGLGREAVLTLLAGAVPRWQIPRQLVTVTLLPRTERGKIDRANLEARFG